MGTQKGHKKSSESKTASTSKEMDPAAKESENDLPSTSYIKMPKSFDELVKAMKPSKTELEFRKKKMSEANAIKKYSKLFKCTKCQKGLKSIIEKKKEVPMHPCLGVLMCSDCCDYYRDGEFSLDSDGEDKYCRWCGEGGTLFNCSKCACGFCTTCIKKHLGIKYFKEVQEDDSWLCFFCNSKPLWDVRLVSSCAMDVAQNKQTLPKAEKKIEEINLTLGDSRNHLGSSSPESIVFSIKDLRNISGGSARKRIYSSSSNESDESSSKPLSKRLKRTSTPLKRKKGKEIICIDGVEPQNLDEFKKLLKLAQYQMSFGMNWSSKIIEKMSSSQYKPTSESFLKECQKAKWFLSVLSSYLVQFCNSMDSIEKQLCSSGSVKKNNSPKDSSQFTPILQFLNFMNKQVKIFMDNGMSLPDIFEGEVYEDAKLIGIKKKTHSLNEETAPTKKPIENKEIDVWLESKSSEKDKVDEEESSREENSSELVIDLHTGFNCTDGEENDSNTTSKGSYLMKNLNPKEDIQDILSILENA